MSTELEQAIEKLGTLESQLSGLSGLPADLIKFRKGISGGLTDIGRIVAGISTNRELQAPLDGVYYNANSPFDGVKQPVGSPRFPCNDWDDVLAIMADRGLTKAYVGSDLALTDDTMGIVIIVPNPAHEVDLDGQVTDGTVIVGGTVTGEQGAMTVAPLILMDSIVTGLDPSAVVGIRVNLQGVGFTRNASALTLYDSKGGTPALAPEVLYDAAVLNTMMTLFNFAGAIYPQGSTSDTNTIYSGGNQAVIVNAAADITVAAWDGTIMHAIAPYDSLRAARHLITMTFSFDETNAAEQDIFETGGFAAGSMAPMQLYLDMTNVTQDTTIRVYVDDVLTYEHDFTVVGDNDGLPLGPLVVLGDVVRVAAICGGGGGGSVDVPCNVS